eukprot:scaffold38093_cov24-Attheya_sp.AAC.1
MPGGGLRRYCKNKTLAFIDTCLDHDELRKVKKCHGFKFTLYNGYDDNDDLFDEDSCDEPCDKLTIYPIGSRKDKFDDVDTLHYDEGETESAYAFLSKSMVFDRLVAAKLLSAFPSDDTSAVCIEYDSENQISGWGYDECCFYPTFILLVTDDLTVAYASMHFEYECLL